MHRHLPTIILLLTCIATSAAARKHKRFKPAIQATTAVIGIGDVDGYLGIGVGVEYERYLMFNGLLTGTMLIEGTNGGDISLGEFGYGDTRSRTNTLFAAPGLRFHPLRNNHRVDIGAGVSVPIGIGGYRSRHLDQRAHESVTREAGLFAAVLGQLSVNFSMARHGIFSVFVAGGPVLTNTRPGPYDYDKPELIQIGLRLGRWW